MLNPARLVFLDETAVSTNLVRLRGRTPRGVRLVGEVPLGSRETITFVVALRQNKMMALMVVKGAINGEMFLAHVRQCLVPELSRDDSVVVDNLQAHKVTGVQETDRERRSNASLPAEIFARPQSDRTALWQTQNVAA
jgi:DDE superfamily endonuclease